MAADFLKTKFSNASEIDEFFKKLNSTGFVDWFNSNHAEQGAFAGNGQAHSIPRIRNEQNWTKVWNNIKTVYNKDKINLLEFLSLNTIISNETGSKFKPSAELIGNNDNPGISYAFNSIPGLKRSYNTLDTNKTAYELFNDDDYIKAHGHKPYGDTLRNTNEAAWRGPTFPTGFSGNTQKELDKSGSKNTFIYEADFMKFRGRGFIQTTGRTAYIELVKFVKNYTGTNSTIKKYKNKWSKYSNDVVLTVSTNDDWDSLFEETDSIIPCKAVYVHSNVSYRDNYISMDANLPDQTVNSKIKLMGKRVSGSNWYAEMFQKRVKQLINDINKNLKKEADTTPITAPKEDVLGDETDPMLEDFSGETELIVTDETVEEPIVDDSSDLSSTPTSDDINGDDTTPDNVEGLTNFFKPTTKVDEIRVSMPAGENTKQASATSIGIFPLIWYNSIQIEPDAVTFFQLASEDLLPTIRIVFNDVTGFMNDKGFPLDDSILKVYISSRNKFLKPIMMEFKITSFNMMGSDYILEGMANINWMYIRKFESYTGSTFTVLKDVAKRSNLGFNSNSNGSRDEMTWIQAESGKDFVRRLINHSYISDETFVWTYVDFYYNLNYIDVEKSLQQNIDNQSGIVDNGMENVSKLSDKDKVSSLYLSNDQSIEGSNMYFENYNILNNSTETSLTMGHKNRIKWYNTSGMELLTFTLESITSNDSNKIILKGKPQDESFFNENFNSIYLGKIDTDNVHKNYYYSEINNKQNLTDLTKIGLQLELTTPNFNLYRFQKIKVVIVNQGSTPNQKLMNGRLNGEWVIIYIKFVVEDSSFKQYLTLVKRELDLGSDEL
jgi:hypothetical protein